MTEFNPLVDSLSSLSDTEVDKKIMELQKKFFMSANPQVKQQIAVFVDMYREEARTRQQKAYEKLNSDNDSDLDNLININ